MAPGGSNSPGRRRVRRSRSRRHHRRRHDHPDFEADHDSYRDGVEPGAWPPREQYPPNYWRGSRSAGPPEGWHGCSGGPPPHSSPGAGPPGSPGHPPAGAPPFDANRGAASQPAPPPGPWGCYGAPPPAGIPTNAPEYRYEAARDCPYMVPAYGTAVPPPPGLDDPARKVSRGSLPDGLVVANIPEEQNTLPALNAHFRKFGEVLKITVLPEEGKASVQFADRGAAEAAAQEPVMGNREITLAWVQRPGSKGKGDKGCGKGAKGGTERIAENRVLVASPEEQQKLEESKRRREEISKRKADLLSSVTDQMKAIMVKMQAADLSEAKRTAYKTLLQQLKAKMDSLSAPSEEVAPLSSAPPGKSGPSGKSSGKSGGKWTLDNRRKAAADDASGRYRDGQSSHNTSTEWQSRHPQSPGTSPAPSPAFKAQPPPMEVEAKEPEGLPEAADATEDGAPKDSVAAKEEVPQEESMGLPDAATDDELPAAEQAPEEPPVASTA